jgi:hypothetical protein
MTHAHRWPGAAWPQQAHSHREDGGGASGYGSDDRWEEKHTAQRAGSPERRNRETRGYYARPPPGGGRSVLDRRSPARSPAGPFPFADPSASPAGRTRGDVEEREFTGGQKEIDAAHRRAEETEKELLACREALAGAQSDAVISRLENEVG